MAAKKKKKPVNKTSKAKAPKTKKDKGLEIVPDVNEFTLSPDDLKILKILDAELLELRVAHSNVREAALRVKSQEKSVLTKMMEKSNELQAKSSEIAENYVGVDTTDWNLSLNTGKLSKKNK